MNNKLLRVGFVLWIVGTLALRLGGQYVLRPDASGFRTLVLFVVSFALMAGLAWRLCTGVREAASLALPTLLLDPFSCAFFPIVFPNLAPEVAGVFGGWMLIFCAGALTSGFLREKAA